METRFITAHGRSLAPRRDNVGHHMPPETAVLVVGKHALVRDGLTLALKHAAPAVSTLTAASLDDALAAFRLGTPVGLVVLDLSSVGDQNAHALQLQWFTRQIQPVGTVVIFDHLDALTMSILRESGTRGLISRHSSLIDVERALRRVLQGNFHWPDMRELGEGMDTGRAVACDTIAGYGGDWMPSVGLTSRQRVVLSLLMRGLSNKQICKELGLAMSTTKAHLSAIFRCLQVDSRAQAIIEAKHRGWSPNALWGRP